MDKQKGHLQSVWHTHLFICFGTVPFIYLLFFVTLQITPESENDFGSYNCSASNDMGTESKEFLLIQAGQWILSFLELTVFVSIFSTWSELEVVLSI